MNDRADRHFPEDILEAYAMGKLSARNSAPLEEHLLICLACRTSLEAIDEFILVTRAATANLAPKRLLPRFNTQRIPELFGIAAIAALEDARGPVRYPRLLGNAS